MYKPADASEAVAALRFDFSGHIVPAGAAIDVRSGLHHHGDSPQAAGYTLKELFLLARSTVAAQRVVALRVRNERTLCAKTNALLCMCLRAFVLREPCRA